MKPTLNWWLSTAKQLGERMAEQRGVVFFGAQASPVAAMVEQRFGIGYERLAIQVPCEIDAARAFNRAYDRLEEWTSTLPVLQYLEPMAVGL